MNVEIKSGDKGKKILTITVTPEEQQPFLDKAAVKLSLQKPISGFRPGKAPREVVEKKYGKMAVLEKAVDDIITHTYYQAITNKNLTVVGRPQIDIKTITPEADFVYTAEVVLLPKVKLGDWQKKSVAEPKVRFQRKRLKKFCKTCKK